MSSGDAQSYFVVGDAHGCAYTAQRLVSRAPEGRRIVLLGDYVDRGKNSMLTVSLVRQWVDEKRVIALKGNHEEMMALALLGGRVRDNDNWLAEGGDATIDSYGPSRGKLLDDAAFLDALPLYHLDPPYLLSHAGVPPDTSLDEAVNRKLILWNRGWLSDQWQQVAGHTPQREPIIHPGKWASIDTGCHLYGKLTALLLPEWETVHENVDERDRG